MSEMITITNDTYTIPAHLASSEATEPRPAVILVHEVWGLTDHIKNVTNRLSKEGFTVLAPDLLKGTELEELITPEFVTDMSDPEKRAARQIELRKLMAPLSSPEFSKNTIEKLQACFEYLKSKPEIGNVGVIGFCFGGTYSFGLATHQPELKAAVPFYGHCDYSATELANINCPILAFYGEQDHNLIDKLPELDAAMKGAGKDFTYKVYPDTGHAFFNDTNPVTYNASAANDAWPRMLSFLHVQLG